MSAQTVDAAIDILLDDDVANLQAHIHSTETDVRAVYEVQDHGDDYDVSLLTHSIQVNALKCVAWLKEQNVDLSKRVYVNPDTFVEYANKASEDKNDDESICVSDIAYTPLQLATVLHGRHSEMADLLRMNPRTRLREGFDRLYFVCFRKSFAPGQKAAKRARIAFETDAVP